MKPVFKIDEETKNTFVVLQEDMIKACIHFHETQFKILIKEGLRLKGFEFGTDDEFYEFIKKECKLFYDKDLNMNFYVYSLIDKDIYYFKDWIHFLYIENPNKFNLNYEQKLDVNFNFEIKYKFI